MLYLHEPVDGPPLRHYTMLWSVQISNKSSYALVNLIPESRRVLTAVSPVTCKKAIKNAVEINGMRRAHVSHLPVRLYLLICLPHTHEHSLIEWFDCILV